MDGLDLTLRVIASGRHGVRVTTRGVQLSIGRPVEFDSEAPDVSALECALAALGRIAAASCWTMWRPW
jgi:hypothetical protein